MRETPLRPRGRPRPTARWPRSARPTRRENDAVYDGLVARRACGSSASRRSSSTGVFPLAEILDALLEIGQLGHERAGRDRVRGRTCRCRRASRREFGFLQMRPLALSRERRGARARRRRPASGSLCRSASVLGQRPHRRTCATSSSSTADRFDRARSREVAQRGRRGSTPTLAAEGAPYLLIGVGRWGSRDPWLGIPVTWDQISGARVDRRGRLPRLPGHAVAGQPLLPEPDLVRRRLLHRQPRRGRGLRGLGLARRAAGACARRRSCATCASTSRSS